MSEEVALAIEGLSKAVRALGNGDACTHMGAIENLACETKSAGELVAGALSEIASAIHALACAVE